MIYILSLLLCLYLAWMYDVIGRTKNKWRWYYLLMTWFIVLSGFQYMVGSDMPGYMESYQNDFNHLRFDIDNLGGHHQPGWVLLCYMCKQISDDFFLLKIVQAIFANVAFFVFFKRESNYPFFCILLYAITTYLVLNFNILRQSFSIGFVLLFISFLNKKRYVLSLLFLFMAYMFHNSSLVALVVPLFKCLHYNKYTFFLSFISMIVLIVFFVKIDLSGIISNVLESGILGNNLEEHTKEFTKSDKFFVKENTVGPVRLAHILLIILPLIYYIKQKKDIYFGAMGFVFLILQVLDFSFPIMFRFRYYFDPVFYIIFSTSVIELSLSRLKQVRFVAISICFIYYSVFPYLQYRLPYKGSPYRYIDQYYPYHSIFEKEDIDHNKINYFKWI